MGNFFQGARLRDKLLVLCEEEKGARGTSLSEALLDSLLEGPA